MIELPEVTMDALATRETAGAGATFTRTEAEAVCPDEFFTVIV
jgi:hypothetical protein